MENPTMFASRKAPSIPSKDNGHQKLHLPRPTRPISAEPSTLSHRGAVGRSNAAFDVLGREHRRRRSGIAAPGDHRRE